MKLLPVWWLLSFLGSAVYWSYLNPSNVRLVAPPIVETKFVPQEHRIEPSRSSEFHPETNIDMDELVEKILQSPKIHNIVNNYHNNIKIEQQSETDRDEELINTINELKAEINKVRAELTLLEETKTADLDRIASRFQTENVRNVAHLTHKLNRCCNKPMINLAPYISSILGNLLNDPRFLSNQKGFSDWLQALFVAKQDLEVRLLELTQNLTQNYQSSIDHTAKQVMEKIVSQLSVSTFDGSSITEDQIRKIVKSTLMVYDADKTGLVDYAMEPIGGQIVTTRCTESYHAGTAVISVLGVPLWYPSNSPRIVIVPGINPGECWAFQNFPGFVVIKLANRIRVEGFSMEHISKLLVPGGKIDSAPKEFEVFGLNDENDRDPVRIGDYVYDADGDPIQHFVAQQAITCTMVEVRIKSNHGNPNYTCLYRFRVHGTISNEPT